MEQKSLSYEELLNIYHKVKQYEQIYRVAMSMTNHTITIVDIKNRTLNQIHNEGEWTGIDVSMPDAPESIIATGIIHPLDCDGYRKFYHAIYSGVPEGEFTMRVLEDKRGWVWFRMTYKSVFNEAGEAVSAICFSDDITREKKAEEAYSQYRSAVTANADFIWEINLTQDTIVSKDSRLKSLPMVQDSMTYTALAENLRTLVHDEGQRELLLERFGREQLLASFREGKREITYQHMIDYNDGTGEHWLQSTAYLTNDNMGDISLIFCSSDITARHKELELLELKAERDALTGLYNRHSFIERAELVLKDFPDETHGFIMIDVDNFKHFNDSYGHSFGDGILQIIAKVMQKTFRTTDYLGRIGGDEFVVFMRGVKNPDIIRIRANELLQNLLQACEEQNLPVPVTLSIGASASQPADTFNSMYLRSDEAMYQSKHHGRNRVTFYEN